MAFISQERKAGMQAKLKALLPKSWKWSLAVDNHSSIVFNLREAPVDFMGASYAHGMATWGQRWKDMGHAAPNLPEYIQLNVYYWQEHLGANKFDAEDAGPLGKETIELLGKALDILNDGNYNNSDMMTDYHDVGWYVDVNLGRWNKPYINSAAEKAAA
jgi:hypothetical protein